MSISANHELRGSLELPDAFEDLTGVLHADLRVIVAALTERAAERSLLSRGQARRFQTELWNNLTQAINRAVQPLDANRR